LQNIPNGHKNDQHFPILAPPKFTQIGNLGLNINHLAAWVVVVAAAVSASSDYTDFFATAVIARFSSL
jgi:hypothetical protein